MLLIEYISAGRSHKKTYSIRFRSNCTSAAQTDFVLLPDTGDDVQGWRLGDMHCSGYHFGVSHAHHFWTWRNLYVLSDLFQRASTHRYSREMMFVCTSFAVKTGSRIQHWPQRGQDQPCRASIQYTSTDEPCSRAESVSLASGKVDDLKCVFELPKRLNRVSISTCSSTNLVGSLIAPSTTSLLTLRSEITTSIPS